VLWALILLLVGGRFLVLLIGANRESEIVDWVLSRGEFWVEPFFGIFGLANEAVERSGGVFEPASLIAFIVYFVVGALILRLLAQPFSWTHPRRRTRFGF
jgi:hypothetical protein